MMCKKKKKENKNSQMLKLTSGKHHINLILICYLDLGLYGSF